MKRIALYCAHIIRVVGVISSALFLPWFFLVYRDEKSLHAVSAYEFKLGVENLTPDFIKSLCLSEKKGSKVGLITNATGTDQMGVSTVQRLIQFGVPLKKVFATDTQFRFPAFKADNKPCSIPLVALKADATLHTTLEQHMRGLNVLFFDVQDSGMRYYQTITILFEAIKIGALYDKTIIVLDRPNLLGSSIEGSLDTFTSDSLLPLTVPLRYGMTIGELARYFNLSVLKQAARLFVVPMEGYERIVSAHGTHARQMVSLQTHIDTTQSTNLLSILAEVHPFDMALETDYAYRCILLPECMHGSKQTWHDLKVLLQEHHIESGVYRYYNQKKHQYMTGLRLKTVDERSLSSFNTLVTILRFFKEKGVRMSFSETFDKALGSNSIRAYLEGRLAWDQLEADINKGLKHFYAKAQHAFIYKPYPKIVMM